MNKIYILIIVVLAGAFLLRECEHKVEKDALVESLGTVSEFFEQEKQSFFAGMDSIVVSQTKDIKQQFVTSIDDITALSEKYPELRDIDAIIKAELHSMISGVNLGYILDTTYLAADLSKYIPRDSVRKYFIPKGSKVSDTTTWYDIALTLGDSLQIDSLKVREKIDAILAWKKPDKSLKWLRKSEPVVSIQSYNPHTDIGYLNNLVVREEKSKFVKVLTSKPMMIVYGAGGAYLLIK